MNTPAADPAELWADAVLAAVIFAIDPIGLGGLLVRARSGPVRDRWCQLLGTLLAPGAPTRRLPLGITEDRLLGGLDLTATLSSGRAIAERGVLSAVDGGVLFAPMAERLELQCVAHLGAALDTGRVVVERDGLTLVHPAHFGLVALDEGIGPEERTSPALADRLAIHLDLDQVRSQDSLQNEEDERVDLAEARAELPAVTIPEAMLDALTQAASALGITSLRAPILAAKVARISAVIAGRSVVEVEDAELAARLVLSPRATRLPSRVEDEPESQDDPEATPPAPEPEAEPNEAPGPSETEEDTAGPIPEVLPELILAAAAAALPADLLAQLSQAREPRGAKPTGGGAGAARSSPHRGRRVGVRRGLPIAGQRLNVLETLRAAAPWQPLRRQERGETSGRILIRADDFRINRYQEHAETTTIFAVDASGSAALQRLAEAKGAVEQVLADCYVRRDHVALIAFRGEGAALLLPPTRSLVRAKRSLAGLPGGGATPLAAGIDAALQQALDARRRGQTPVIVVISDGRGNVARDGKRTRVDGEADARLAARTAGRFGLRALFIDTSVRPNALAQSLAAEMNARYLALPHVDPGRVAQELRREAEGAGR
ncbi:MAG: magnesium chelatase subunit D [Deltaproteobacteria bacterium]|nr:magnesium chelatase subunit D [Deltaproteobacteria bacterium]